MLKKSPISSKTTLAQRVLTPILSNRTVAHGVWTSFSFLTKVAKLKQKTVAQRVLTPISSNRTVAHRVSSKI